MEELRVYNTIDSTNVEAQRLLTNPSTIPHGTTLVAHHQAAGKGQFGREWHAEPGHHLAMSIILKPENVLASELPRFSKLISLAICRVLEKLDPGFQPKIKWPNDILLNGKKTAGILIENALAGNRIQHIIAGIGMNINETHFPPDLPNAISLAQVSGNEFDILDIATSIRSEVLNLLANPSADWGMQYSLHLYKRLQLVDFDQHGNLLRGEVLDVDDQGRLVLRIGEHVQSYYTHEIKWTI